MKSSRPFLARPLGLSSLLTAALALAAAPAVHAQSVVNGSFEDPALPSGGFLSGGGTGWTASGSYVYIETNTENMGDTQFGTQYLDLIQSGSNAQTLTGPFTINRTYTLSLAASDLGGRVGQLAIAISGGATASRTINLAARPDGFADAAIPFVTYTLNFTPTTSAAITLTLTNATNASTSFIAVDNVQVVVPEPSTWAAVAAGAGLLGVVTLRRRRAAARA